ncbi:MAG: lactoylglutathione lyase [Candidatus Doudnabacteria bacterium]|nr:lactoylglutathione lyase [Candidatus Doudnabacteria bacterium]
MNAPSYFEIQVEDTQRAVNFYQEIFGWKFTKDENIPIEYWRIETEGARGGLLKRPVSKPTPSGTNAFVCSMEVKGFDSVSEKILQLGGQIALPKFAVMGVCWQGYFLDTEGNTFGLFEPDLQAK